MRYLIIIVIFLLVLWIFNQRSVEHYWDITPYQARWDIDSCLSPKCAVDTSYKCYQWCDNIEEPGARDKCKINCADEADIQFTNLKLGAVQFNYLLPRFKKYSLLNGSDYVNWPKGEFQSCYKWV